MDIDALAIALGGDPARAKFLAYRQLQGLVKSGEVRRMANGVYKLLKKGEAHAAEIAAAPKSRRAPAAKRASVRKEKVPNTSIKPLLQQLKADKAAKKPRTLAVSIAPMIGVMPSDPAINAAAQARALKDGPSLMAVQQRVAEVAMGIDQTAKAIDTLMETLRGMRAKLAVGL